MIRASRAVDDLILANGKYYADWELQFPASDADMLGLTARERATVVAALREFEESLLAHGTLADLKQEHAGHFELHAPLDADEIDALCERINR